MESILFAVGWALCGYLAFGLTWGDWWRNFGPEAYGPHGRWGHIGFDKYKRISLKRERRSCVFIGLLGPIGLLVAVLVADELKPRFKWSVDD